MCSQHAHDGSAHIAGAALDLTTGNMQAMSRPPSREDSTLLCQACARRTQVCCEGGPGADDAVTLEHVHQGAQRLVDDHRRQPAVHDASAWRGLVKVSTVRDRTNFYPVGTKGVKLCLTWLRTSRFHVTISTAGAGMSAEQHR